MIIFNIAPTGNQICLVLGRFSGVWGLGLRCLGLRVAGLCMFELVRVS